MTASQHEENQYAENPYADSNYRQPDWDYSYAQSQGYMDTASQQRIPLPHSSWGIASFSLALLSAIGFSVLIGFCVSIFMSHPDMAEIAEMMNDPEFLITIEENHAEIPPPFKMLALAGLGMLACLVVQFIAMVLGLIGLFQPGTRRTFALLGIVLSGAPFLFTVGCMVLSIS